MALTPDQIDDMVTLTLARYERDRYADIYETYQNFTVVDQMYDKARINIPGGTSNKWQVMVDGSGNARNTEMYAVDQTNVQDVMATCTVEHRMQTFHWSYDIDEEAFQSDLEKLVDLIKVREHDAEKAFVNLDEANFWTAPTSSSDNRPNGVPYWIVKSATTGFNGGAPSGHTTVGGLSPTTYPNWKNYTFQYVSVSKTDLIRKMRTAMRKCHFEPPVPFKDLKKKDKYGIYTTETVLGTLEEVLEAQNDNLGADLDPMGGKTMFKSNRVHWVAYLTENDSTNPVYGINWGSFLPFCKEGGHMRRHKPKQAPLQHTVRNVHTDNWKNYKMYDRRSQFVGYV